MLEKRKNLIVWIAVFALSFLIYGQTLFHDGFALELNSSQESNQGSSSIVAVALSALNLSSPFASLLSILVYSVIGGLLFSTLSKLLSLKYWSVAVLAALIFIIHPAHTENVAHIIYGEELIALFLGLISWLLIIKGARNRPKLWVISAFVFFGLAVFINATISPLAIAIPASIWFFNIGSRRFSASSFIALVVSTLVVFMIAINGWWHYPALPYKISESSWSFGQAFVAFSYYLKLSFWPYPLSIYYGYNALSFDGWSSQNSVLSVLLITSLFLIGLRLITKRSIGGFGVFFLFLGLFPVANVLYPLEALVVERALLLPTIGSCLLIATSLNWLTLNTNRFLGYTSCVLVIIGFTALSFARTSQWKDYETLIQADVTNYPKSARLLLLNGDYYFGQIPDFDGNERHLLAKKSISYLLPCSKLEPSWSKPHLQLGVLFDRELNQPFEAIPHYERALKLMPKSFASSFNLAGCYSQMGMQDSTVYYIKKTLDINPEHYESLEFLTSYYFKTENIRLGFGFANRFIQIYPQSDVPHLIFAEYYFKEVQELKAIQQLEIAAQKNPVNKETLKTLFDYYYAKKDFDKAEQYRDIAVYN